MKNFKVGHRYRFSNPEIPGTRMIEITSNDGSFICSRVSTDGFCFSTDAKFCDSPVIDGEPWIVAALSELNDGTVELVENKKYSIIYVDPPWSFRSKKTGGTMKSGAAYKYPVMTLDQLQGLDVPALCEKDCVLIMWYVSSQPQEALDLVKAWGFTVKNMNAFIWRKLSVNRLPHFGMGYWTRSGAECALIAVRGKPQSVCKSIRQVRDEPVGEHSEKPAVFRDDIVKLCGDLPRLEMFARNSSSGWDVFGNEVESSISISTGEI